MSPPADCISGEANLERNIGDLLRNYVLSRELWLKGLIGVVHSQGHVPNIVETMLRYYHNS